MAYAIHWLTNNKRVETAAKKIEREKQDARGKVMMQFHKANRQRLIDEEMSVKDARTT